LASRAALIFKRMNFKDLSPEQKKELSDLMFKKLDSAQELKEWVMAFLGLDMPIHSVDPDSNSSPVDAMWSIYETVKNNTGDVTPGFIMLSARECYKTLGASILEVLLMLHFEVTIAHMAAILSQSSKAIQYINYFFGKVQPLLEVRGWTNTSQNKNKIEYRTPEGEDVYIRVIVCTLGGANSEHTSLMFVDEIDVVKDPMAYEEAKMIPGYTKGIHPLTVKLSTRKFSFGLMQAEIDKAAPGPESSGDQIVRWNILDVTERCPETRHKPELPKVDLYVAKSLPLRHITPSEHAALSDVEKPKWEYVPQAHGGCQDCKLFAVCKTRLSKRGPEATKGLYKPISAVINNFKKLNPDMAEAQLMCWKPSSKGLVYPRFETQGNTLQLLDAFKTLLGEDMKDTARELGWNLPARFTTDDLIDLMKKLKIDFYAGVDWGYTHDFVIVIFAKIPNGEIWVMDCYSMDGLEFSDCLEVAKVYRDKYSPTKWFCDQAMPSHIKSFTKNGMKSPSFTKDVMGGIEALRSKIVDGSGRRFLKILQREDGANAKVVAAFQKHHFKLGPDGNPTLVPDDTPGTSDQADAMRYVAQNLFPVKGTQKINSTFAGGPQEPVNKNPTHTDQMREEIMKRVQGGTQPTSGGSGRKGGFHFNF
jgi:hypothetical protein